MMDIAMRNWLTVLIVLLIVGILLDGLRRMRKSRKNTIRMSSNLGKGDKKGDGLPYRSELPNGGARVIFREEDKGLQKNSSHPEQASLNLEESVPMLMESVQIEPEINESLEDLEDSVELIDEDENKGISARRVEPKLTESREIVDAQEVLVINVMAPKDKPFKGAQLLNTVLGCGMRFGAMNIFHFHEDGEGNGEILFSMANLVVPGTFNLHEMEDFETPGVSVFLTLPLTSDSLAALNQMFKTANVLCEQLNGEMKDENRSVMTPQTIEHYRQRVQDFERKQLSRTHT